MFLSRLIGILLPKLFWPTVRKKCSGGREKLLKLEAEGRQFEITCNSNWKKLLRLRNVQENLEKVIRIILVFQTHFSTWALNYICNWKHVCFTCLFQVSIQIDHTYDFRILKKRITEKTMSTSINVLKPHSALQCTENKTF